MPEEILIFDPAQGRELLKKLIADLEKQEREDFISELEGICLNE